MDKKLNNEKLFFPRITDGIKNLLRRRQRSNEEAARMKKAIEIVEPRLKIWIAEGNYRKKYDSMDSILKELGLAADELSYYCSNRLNTTFLSWRKVLRMEDAKRMLLEYPEMPTSKIANELGISDKSNFRHQFKSVTGLSPSAWREKYLKKI